MIILYSIMRASVQSEGATPQSPARKRAPPALWRPAQACTATVLQGSAAVTSADMRGSSARERLSRASIHWYMREKQGRGLIELEPSNNTTSTKEIPPTSHATAPSLSSSPPFVLFPSLPLRTLMYMYIYLCIYIYIHTYIHASLSYTYIYIYTHTHTYTHITHTLCITYNTFMSLSLSLYLSLSIYIYIVYAYIYIERERERERERDTVGGTYSA